MASSLSSSMFRFERQLDHEHMMLKYSNASSCSSPRRLLMPYYLPGIFREILNAVTVAATMSLLAY